MDLPIVLSAYTVAPIINAIATNSQELKLSPDLGLTLVRVAFDGKNIIFSTGQTISLEDLKLIKEEIQSVFEISTSGIEKIAAFSDFTDRYYSLYPTRSAPTMLLSGIPMHRIKDTDPYADTLTKIRAAKPAGLVLDTTTGLGYTAIESAANARQVITIELDPAVIELCRRNPWSARLFNNPKISQLIGDSFDLIRAFPDGCFSCVIHDPPMFSLAGDLYSGEFYEQAFRILKPHGRIFHYIGDPKSPSGKKVTHGVMKRLSTVGFRNISVRPEAFGVIANK